MTNFKGDQIQMRRFLAALGTVAVAAAVTTVPASAHENQNTTTCGAANSLEATDASLVDEASPLPQGRQIYTVPTPAGTFYIDDRDYVGWWQYGTLSSNLVKNGEASFDGHDHSAGLWVFEESGEKSGLQAGGPAEVFRGIPEGKTIEGAFEGLFVFSDPCDDGSKKANKDIVRI